MTSFLFSFQVLKELAEALMTATVLAPNADNDFLSRPVVSVGSGRRIYNTRFGQGRNKRNSELLNSLLGLPKNILKSGK